MNVENGLIINETQQVSVLNLKRKKKKKKKVSFKANRYQIQKKRRIKSKNNSACTNSLIQINDNGERPLAFCAFSSVFTEWQQSTLFLTFLGPWSLPAFSSDIT